MVEKRKPDAGSSPFNLNSLLALLTLIGGIWLVSHKLASDRPITPAGGARDFVGDQAVEARLWEDPFRTTKRGDQSDEGTTNLLSFIEQVRTRSTSDTSVLLLPVMISGGQHAEDQESRIRSRFAIVSALGTAGFVPEDAEHIGAVRIPWPSSQQIRQVKQNTRVQLERFWEKGLKGPEITPGILGIRSSLTTFLEVRFEWYRQRTFSSNSANKNARDVLVLWLDDSYFEDEPLVRLPLLLELLSDPVWLESSPLPDIALVGPRRSSTLRMMMPDWKTAKLSLAEAPNASLWPLAQKTLRRIAIYCATPSVADEVLVRTPTGAPRSSVKDVLAPGIFASFHNFAATDAQLAKEMCDELKIRNSDPADKQNHIVLISEWDTFYGRMLSLTIRAEIGSRQNPLPTQAGFIEAYISGSKEYAHLPENFHPFVYLRGLDGQTVGGSSDAKDDGADQGRSGRSSPASLEELRRWAPDANKAAGQAQFDYLGRLGDQIHALKKQFKYKNTGDLKAIGIVGSDAYDTLLILQALRPRFPGLIFFTTDLDVRFIHPKERDWARNLIVTSAYGLALHPDLQGDVAPFRDSPQTAQFAACLAALGNPILANLTEVPPRRFEIGNRSAIDISLSTPATALIGPEGEVAKPVHLHPLTYGQLYQEYRPYYKRELGLGLAIAALILAATCWWYQPLRRLTLNWSAPLYEALEYTEEDIGGPEGAETIFDRLQTSADPLAKWLADHHWIKALRDQLLATGTESEREAIFSDLADTLVALLNEILRHKNSSCEGTSTIPDFLAKNPAKKNDSWHILLPIRQLAHQRDARRQLDLFLDNLTSPQLGQKTTEPICEVSALQAATAARKSTGDIFRLRLHRLGCFWLGVVGFGALSGWLACNIWSDTYERDDGERLSFISGTSAWPAEIVRLVVLVLAVCFSFGLYHKMRESYFALTRKFRLSFSTPHSGTARISGVCAVTVWKEYGDRGCFWKRVGRVAILVVLYIGLCLAVVSLSDGSLFNPVRGNVVTVWNNLIVSAAVMGFLALAFLTMDAAFLCREFIRKLGAFTTLYPEAVRRHFSRMRGKIDQAYLGEWIDLQLIAELTEHVGGLAYYPSLLVLLLVVARNSWWDCWAWPFPVIVVFFANFILALASVIILQRAAQKAKMAAEESLTAKVKMLQARVSPSIAQNNAAQAEQLLDEVRNLQRGAFVPFWKNPVVGAIFLSSGGTTMLQLFVWMMGR